MNRVTELARTWLDVPYKHQGRVKDGCDCLGLIVNLDIICKNGQNLRYYDQRKYRRILNSNILLETLDNLLVTIDVKDIQPGNIALLKVGNWPQHLVVIDEIQPHISIIHSYSQVKKIVKQLLPAAWEIVRIYKSL